MASALQKLLRKSPATTIITSFHPSQALPPKNPLELEPLALHRSPIVEVHRPIHPSTSTEHLGSSCSTVIFPSFPFGFPLNPISPTGFRSHEDLNGDDDDSGALWADSVKKKRKRKMNKHKYKKLRKRMRRQS